MNCPKCGSPIDDDSKFCNKCGEKIDFQSNTNANYAPSAENQYSVPAEENQNNGNILNGYDAYPDFLQKDPVTELNTNNEKKKKKRKKTIIAVIVIIVLVLAAAVFGWQYAARAVAGEFSFYLWRESSNAESAVNFDSLESVADNDDISAQTSFTGESGYDSKIKIDYSEDENRFIGTYVMTVENTDVTFKLCYGDNTVTLIVPDTENAKYNTDGSVDFTSQTYSLDINSLTDDDSAFESTIEASDILEILKNTEKNALDKDCVSSKPEFVNGKLCNTVSITLDSDDVSKLTEELIKQAKSNKHVKETVDGYISAIYDTGLLSSYYSTKDEFIDSFYDEIDSAVKDMMTSSDTDNKSTLTLYSSCSLFGNIVRRGAVLTNADGNEDSSVVIDTKTSSASTCEFTAVYTEKGDDGKDEKTTLDYSVSTVSDKMNGEISLKTSDDSTNVKVKLEDITTKKINSVNVITGKANVSGKIDSESISAKISASSDDNYNISCSIKSGDETVFDKTLKITVSSDADMTTYEKAPSDAKPLGDLLEDFSLDSADDSSDESNDTYDFGDSSEDYGDLYNFGDSGNYGSYGFSDDGGYGSFGYGDSQDGSGSFSGSDSGGSASSSL